VKHIAIGLDLGGTFIKAGAIDREGNTLLTTKVPTPEDGQESVLAALAGAGRSTLDEVSINFPDCTVCGVGLGTPGIVLQPEGRIRFAFNINGWDQVPARAYLHGELGVPVQVDNDANCFALAEYMFGAGKDTHSMVALTLGTGVGGGIIVNDRVLHGYSGSAGELGHITVQPNGEQCSCGCKGCLEAYCSADAIAHYARSQIEEGRSSQMNDIALEEITSKHVGSAARQGDALALEALERTGRFLGIGMAAISTSLDPEVIVIGGGGAGLGELLLEPTRRHFAEHLYSARLSLPQVRLAQLGYEAGMTGAACLVFADSQ
jgi:glucokinase